MGPAKVPGDLPEAGTLRQQLVDQGVIGAAAFGHCPGRFGYPRLGAWITTAEQAALPGISRFATGLTADLAAVTAGLTLPRNSGPVEGNVNRIKMLKRQMYGRAGFDPLRKRILLSF